MLPSSIVKHYTPRKIKILQTVLPYYGIIRDIIQIELRILFNSI